MAKSRTLVIASGYFNPIHKGHIEYLQRSKALGRYLVVIVNNDAQVTLKGAKEFQNESERFLIVDNIKCVDSTILAIDADRSVCKTIELIFNSVSNSFDKVLFTNGGDQTVETILERDVCAKLGIKLVDSLGEKIQSSSWLKDKQ